MGRKYIIELEDKPFTNDETKEFLWRVKGFRSLVFDNEGIKRLASADDMFDQWTVTINEAKAYDNGLNSAWETAREITRHSISVLENNTANEAKALLARKAKEDLEIGDEVIFDGIKAVVLDIYDDLVDALTENMCIESRAIHKVKKTGRKIKSVQSVIDEMMAF